MECLRIIGVSKQSTSAVVHDDDVEFPASLGTAKMAGIGRHRLASGTACQQAGEDAEVFQGGDDLFDPHAGDVQVSDGRAQIGIAFVGAHHKHPLLGHGKVDPRDRGIGTQEMLPQVFAGCVGEVLRVTVTRLGAHLLLKQLPHFLFFQMNRRQDDVAGGLTAQLDDPLTQIGVDHFDAMLFEVGVESALFGEHRFGLDHLFDVLCGEDLVDDLVVFPCIGCPVDADAILKGVAFKRFEVVGQVRHCVGFDLRSEGAQVFPFADLFGGGIPLLTHKPEGLVVPAAVLGVGEEGGGFEWMVHGSTLWVQRVAGSG